MPVVRQRIEKDAMRLQQTITEASSSNRLHEARVPGKADQEGQCAGNLSGNKLVKGGILNQFRVKPQHKVVSNAWPSRLFTLLAAFEFYSCRGSPGISERAATTACIDSGSRKGNAPWAWNCPVMASRMTSSEMPRST